MGSMILGGKKPMSGGSDLGMGDDANMAMEEEVDVYGETEAEAMKVLTDKLGSDGASALKAYIDACLAKKDSAPAADAIPMT